jgi:nitrate reductase cytochrome c-type subunit
MSKYLKIIPFAFLFLLFVNCNKSKESNVLKQIDVEAIKINYTESNHPGKKLMETKCYVCHSPTALEKEGRIGPPMIAIKAHYINKQTTKEEFTEAIWGFVEKPSSEKVKLKGAVKRFGIMPYQPFNEKEISQITEYIFDYQIDEPKWFKEHWENGHKMKRKPHKNSDKKDNSSAGVDTEHSRSSKSKIPADLGQEYALNTKKELGKNLMGTIQKKGTLEAVTFCNKQAYPITDSMVVAQNASIRRVSDKPRNPENQANAKELGIIARFKKAIANNEEYQPVTEIKNGEVKFYAPITTNSMCLQCHGSSEKDIEPKVLTALTSLYPKDKATGYDVNEVRGIWSITYKQ